MQKVISSMSSVTQRIQAVIGGIDQRINKQVNAILHHDDFQALESRWRGLFMLAVSAKPHKSINVRMLDVDYVTLNQDIVNSVSI